jgi:cold shock CspA family protein
MQGTVRSYDPATGAGSVFLDDGSVCEFSPAVFAASGLRLLRPGQRVTLRCRTGGTVSALTLATFPLPGESAEPGLPPAAGSTPAPGVEAGTAQGPCPGPGHRVRPEPGTGTAG